MKFCTKCVMPETKPNLHFDQDGVCDACRSQENKNIDIDWGSRKAEFLELIKKYKKHPIYDCVIGVSGGKDSTFQVLTMLNLGLNPLCVCFEPTIPTKVGRKNLKNLNNLGVDIIHIKRDPIVYKKLAKEAFKRTGDNEWQNHLGIFTCVPRIAVNFGIPLIIWGESPQLEYGGPATSKDNNILDKNWLDKFGGLLGNSIEDMIGVDGLDEKDLYFYTYPSDEELKRVNVTGLFLGYYFKWDYKENLRISQENGFKCSDRPVETTYENFENLEEIKNNEVIEDEEVAESVTKNTFLHFLLVKVSTTC